MKFLLAYTIWNKCKMLEWLCEGIPYSFNPKEVDLLFLLDDPQDGSDKKIEELRKTILKEFKSTQISFGKEGRKFICHNAAIDIAINGGYDFAIMPQDDQKMQDKEFINNIKKIDKQYGNTLGYIGMRDGYDWGYGNMVSSEWSESAHVKRRLKAGEWAEVQLVNDGGMVYSNRLMKLLGHHDTENFFHYYIETDYAMAAHVKGLKNIVMGNNLIHKKPDGGATFNCQYELPGHTISANDIAAFRKKWNV